MAQRDARDLDRAATFPICALPRGLGRRLLPQRGLLDLFGHLFDLAHHLLRRLVLAHALQRALADQLAAGPAAEFHLDHDLRLDPFHLARRRSSSGILSSGVSLRATGVEPSLQIALLLLAPAGADAAGVAQPALLVIAEQQRADQAAALVGWLVADDDELLVAGALGLEPVAAAAGAIGRIGALRDDAFEVQVCRRA